MFDNVIVFPRSCPYISNNAKDKNLRKLMVNKYYIISCKR